MKTPNRRAPADLALAISDLVAEGGNVLASDDAPLVRLLPDEYPFDADVPLSGEARGNANKGTPGRRSGGRFPSPWPTSCLCSPRGR